MVAISDLKRNRGRPRVYATPMTLRIPPNLLRALDAYRKAEPPEMNRAVALRRIATEFLTRRGFM